MDTKKLIQQEIEQIGLTVESQKKTHTEIMDNLVDSNQTNGLETKKINKRIDSIEKHLDLASLKHKLNKNTMLCVLLSLIT